MKYNKIVQVATISQWRDTDINYEFLRMFIVTIQKILDGIIQYEEALHMQSQYVVVVAREHDQEQSRRKADEYISELKIVAKEINGLFLRQLAKQVEISQIFCRMKFNQVDFHADMCIKYASLANDKQKRNVLLRFLEYTYIETVYLCNQLQQSQDQQRRAIKKHKKSVQNRLEVATPQMAQFVKIPLKRVQETISTLEKLFVELKITQEKDNRLIKKLKRISKRQKQKTLKQELRTYPTTAQAQSSHTFIFGLMVGLFIAVIVFMSLLIIYRGQSVDQDPIFNRDFPIWRGIAYIILYIWVFGFNIYYFQAYRISYHIILDYVEHHRASYTNIFNIAGIFSAIFSIFFALYVLAISGIISLGEFPSIYFGLIVWVLFVVFMVNPFPIFYHRSRRYIFKTISRIFISPFFPVPIAIGWIMDQMLSLITSFSDLAYTVCYFTNMDFKNTLTKDNKCRRPVSIIVFTYVLIMLVYKITHCFRKGYDNGKFLWQKQFWNLFKYCISILTLNLSFMWNGTVRDSIFTAWIIFTIIGTVYSCVIDLKFDFGLLDRKAQHWMLRDKIMYSPIVYYVIMVCNLALRLVWVLTLSPNIAQKGFGSPEIFRLVTGGLQIFRRGIWNLIKLQNQHIQLCNELRAMPKNYYELQKKISQKINTKTQVNPNIPNSNTQQNLFKNMTINQSQKVGGVQWVNSNISQNIRPPVNPMTITMDINLQIQSRCQNDTKPANPSQNEAPTLQYLKQQIKLYELERSQARKVLQDKNVRVEVILDNLKQVIEVI